MRRVSNGDRTIYLGVAIHSQSDHQVARLYHYVSPPCGKISWTDFTSSPGGDSLIKLLLNGHPESPPGSKVKSVHFPTRRLCVLI